MRVGAPVFCGLEPGADAPKSFRRSEAMVLAASPRVAFAPSQFSNEANKVAMRASPVCLVRFSGKSLLLQMAVGVNSCQDRHLTAAPIQIAQVAGFAQRGPWRHWCARDFG